jgi:enamine deaminase RidA (YjgF/YER057c/UK114 family)
LLSISGQIAEGADAGEQARRCLQAIDELLTAAGASKTDVVRLGIFVTDMVDRAAIADARIEYFGDHRPAATLVEVSALVSPDFKVEIEATAIF